MKRFLCEAVSAFQKHHLGVIFLGLSLLTAFIGPFGSFEAMSLPLRFAYWMPIILGAQLFVRLSQRVVTHWFRDVSGLRGQLLLICAFALMYSPVVWLLSGLFASEFLNFDSLIFISINVFGVTFLVGILVYFAMPEKPVSVTLPTSRLYDRLPDDTRGSVVRLTVDDHYVVVHLDDGTIHRVLMRFGDAVREMDDTVGFFTHRSHWVAAAYAQALVRENDRDYLMLESGAKVPISKTYRDKLLAAGLG